MLNAIYSIFPNLHLVDKTSQQEWIFTGSQSLSNREFGTFFKLSPARKVLFYSFFFRDRNRVRQKQSVIESFSAEAEYRTDEKALAFRLCYQN